MLWPAIWRIYGSRARDLFINLWILRTLTWFNQIHFILSPIRWWRLPSSWSTLIPSCPLRVQWSIQYFRQIIRVNGLFARRNSECPSSCLFVCIHTHGHSTTYAHSCSAHPLAKLVLGISQVMQFFLSRRNTWQPWMTWCGCGDNKRLWYAVWPLWGTLVTIFSVALQIITEDYEFTPECTRLCSRNSPEISNALQMMSVAVYEGGII